MAATAKNVFETLDLQKQIFEKQEGDMNNDINDGSSRVIGGENQVSCNDLPLRLETIKPTIVTEKEVARDLIELLDASSRSPHMYMWAPTKVLVEKLPADMRRGIKCLAHWKGVLEFLQQNRGRILSLLVENGFSSADIEAFDPFEVEFWIEDFLRTHEFKWEFPKKLKAAIRTLNDADFARHRIKYGPKAANLRKLARLCDLIQGIVPQCITFTPPFYVVPIDLYHRWSNGIEVRLELMHPYMKMKDYPLIVRSTQLYSEDSERVTGAGRGLSLVVKDGKAGCSFDDFVKTVQAVYESVESEGAQEYRKYHNIMERELTGLIAQHFQPGVPATCQSVHPGRPDLVAVSIATQRTNQKTGSAYVTVLLKKSRVLASLARGEVVKTESMFYSPVDMRVMSPLIIGQLAQVGVLLELIWGQPVQVEFVCQTNSVTKHDSELALVQVRPLPAAYNHVSGIELKGGNEVEFTARAVGTIDEDLPLLDPSSEQNGSMDGIVIFSSSYTLSSQLDKMSKLLPKRGVLLMLNTSENSFGSHLEVLAMERKLVVCFMPEPQQISILTKDHLEGYRNRGFRVRADGTRAEFSPPERSI